MTTNAMNNVYHPVDTPEYDSWEEALDAEVEVVADKVADKVDDKVDDKVVVELEPLDDEFPALGNWTTITKGVKGESKLKSTKGRSKGVPMDIAPTSRIAELRGERPRPRSDGGVDEERSLAFDKLGNKEELSRDLAKTRLCHSVASGNPCPHGERCRFAHSQSELVLATCFFGGRCRFVKWGQNQQKWYNNCGGGGKMCNHIHPDETRENYMSRTGMVKAPVSTEVVKAPVSTEVDPVLLKLVPIQVMHRPPIEETVIKVPQCMAAQAIELALKSGKHNVRVEVI